MTEPLCEDKIIAFVKQRIHLKTYRHILSVGRVMEEVAIPLRLRPDKARVAGLLHDLHKGTDPNVLLQLAEEYEIPFSETARIKPALLHGPVAAEVCRRELGIDDDIYEAIFWHTTGKPNLNKMGLALVFADFSEPLREHPESKRARELYERKGFFPALRYVAQRKLEHAQQKPPVDPHTQAFCTWLEQHLS
ncbi:MAG TPA: bis(5'-nucleosyl)-tetraphosphatase (symmetrical) YqeK [Candidatus Hydrogenedentes bacterium]|nr:bis(5'-nucleosyl)-tetraphosphatase (symmetrical) YqeK [Candidatus Hydrogenedentota bacterium]HOL76408.1 bis(5'-nucleosyl)-tetraphosphatase (symmetrical) YqeK [Candidatus Hydrogenedentota bacterium]HPO85446.1 bis(5'-nucleosyl)-tetraphosphatase (symmetrical) YqeK [Candidatus Hydrogenedentota bacterium]